MISGLSTIRPGTSSMDCAIFDIVFDTVGGETLNDGGECSITMAGW